MTQAPISGLILYRLRVQRSWHYLHGALGPISAGRATPLRTISGSMRVVLQGSTPQRIPYLACELFAGLVHADLRETGIMRAAIRIRHVRHQAAR